jgi:hypothetical protein
MPYKVIIQNEQGEPLAGVVYFWLDGDRLGEAIIPAGGTTLTDEQVEIADRFTVTADGYHFYGTSNLYDDNIFTLARKVNTGLYVAVALVGGFILSKLVKFKL